MPENVGQIGRLLMLAGGVLFILGAVFILLGRLPHGTGPSIGRLPGDFVIKRGNWTVYLPLGTSLLLSLLASLLFGLFGRR